MFERWQAAMLSFLLSVCVTMLLMAVLRACKSADDASAMAQFFPC